jgi:hypothetical protein
MSLPAHAKDMGGLGTALPVALKSTWLSNCDLCRERLSRSKPDSDLVRSAESKRRLHHDFSKHVFATTGIGAFGSVAEFPIAATTGMSGRDVSEAFTLVVIVAQQNADCLVQAFDHLEISLAASRSAHPVIDCEDLGFGEAVLAIHRLSPSFSVLTFVLQ